MLKLSHSLFSLRASVEMTRGGGRRWAALLLLLLCSIDLLPHSSAESDERRRSVIDVDGGPHGVVWVVQLSDLHFSVFNPERSRDFATLVGPALAMINPSLVLITGDLTDGKSKDLLKMKQEEAEWIDYEHVMDDVIRQSRLDRKIFYDLKGNHDSFGVPKVGGAYDFYQKYSMNSRLGRLGNVQSVTLRADGWKHVFVGFDSTMEIGLRGPTNLFGHPSDKLLKDLEAELSQWDSTSENSRVTKISFGHFPLSFSASTDTGKGLKDVFLKHSLSTYLCGHLHTRFGKNLKRHHTLSSGKYYQFNIHEGKSSNIGDTNCSRKTEATKEFWEWEMGDWRRNRAVRIIAIDSGHVSFLDTNFKFGSMETIIVPTFPLDSRFMQRVSSQHDYECEHHTIGTAPYETIRALIFSRKVVMSVSAKVYDSVSGKLIPVLDSAMVKLGGQEEARGNLYACPWNWRAFEDSSPYRFWLQIEVTDISGTTSSSELRPFSINGLTFRVSWRWKEFFVMGFQWASIYHPFLWTVFPLLFLLVLIPRAALLYSKKFYAYSRVKSSHERKGFSLAVGGAFWILTELARMTIVWSGVLLYLIYLLFFPWFSGYIFTESNVMAHMSYKGWDINASTHSNDHDHIGVPDVMVIVVPHFFFVVLPTVLVVAIMASERTAYRTRLLLSSGKKEDDHLQQGRSRRERTSLWDAFCFSRWRWFRKFLLLICLAILWKHGKQCRALVKAYDMNPFLHSPAYCFSIPVLLIYAIYTTTSLQ